MGKLRNRRIKTETVSVKKTITAVKNRTNAGEDNSVPGEVSMRSTGRANGRRNGRSIVPDDLIKWIFALIIIILIVGKFTANRTSKASFESVQKAVEKTVKNDKTMLEGDKNMVKRLYGLNPADYEGVMLKYPSTNMNVNEVFLVKLKNLAQQKPVQDAIEKRLETQKKNFDGYGTNQYSILGKSVIDVRGNYVMFVVAEETDPIVNAFENSLR